MSEHTSLAFAAEIAIGEFVEQGQSEKVIMNVTISGASTLPLNDIAVIFPIHLLYDGVSSIRPLMTRS
jgi:hypothetical protein